MVSMAVLLDVSNTLICHWNKNEHMRMGFRGHGSKLFATKIHCTGPWPCLSLQSRNPWLFWRVRLAFHPDCWKIQTHFLILSVRMVPNPATSALLLVRLVYSFIAGCCCWLPGLVGFFEVVEVFRFVARWPSPARRCLTCKKPRRTIDISASIYHQP